MGNTPTARTVDNRLVVRGVGDGHKVMAKTRSTFVVENDLVENLDGDGPAADIVTREIDHSGPAASDLVSTRQTWDTQLTRHTTVLVDGDGCRKVATVSVVDLGW